MKVGNGKKVLLPFCDPLLPLFALAFGAMAIPATIVADPHRAASGAGVYMTAQFCRPATLDRSQRPQLPAVDMGRLLHRWPMLV